MGVENSSLFLFHSIEREINENEMTTFTISNDTDGNMTIIHEPECFEFMLPINEEITIETDSCKNSIHLKTYIEDGLITIAILGNKSLYSVYYKGNNIFEKYL